MRRRRNARGLRESNCEVNLVEQINQTWTYLVALAAAKQLLELHPEANGYRLAPGAHASQALDIMSEADGLVGAETFAAVHPRNNDKLNNDLRKMAARTELNRYIFSCLRNSPGQLVSLNSSDGVQVWSVNV